MVENGFDASIEFQPFSNYLYEFIESKTLQLLNSTIKYRIFKELFKRFNIPKYSSQLYEKCKKIVMRNLEYSEFVDYLIKHYQFEQEYVKFPGITPSWDNTARRGNEAFFLKN
ncbi:MAG: hypothetical protein B7Y13_10220, partial [Sulfurovum sp. 24-42-9]